MSIAGSATGSPPSTATGGSNSEPTRRRAIARPSVVWRTIAQAKLESSSVSMSGSSELSAIVCGAADRRFSKIRRA